MYQRFLILMILLALVSLGTDCRTARVRFDIYGNMNSQVVFQVRDHQGRRMLVEEFLVVALHDPSNAGDDEVVWHLRGEGRVNRVVYGEVPNGLTVVMGPLPLRPGEEYSIAVRGAVSDLVSLRGAGVCSFSIGETGAVVGSEGCRLTRGDLP